MSCTAPQEQNLTLSGARLIGPQRGDQFVQTVLLQPTAAEDGDSLSQSMSNSLIFMRPFPLLRRIPTSLIAAHYVRGLLILCWSLHVGPGGRRAAAAPHLLRCSR